MTYEGETTIGCAGERRAPVRLPDGVCAQLRSPSRRRSQPMFSCLAIATSQVLTVAQRQHAIAARPKTIAIDMPLKNALDRG